MSGLNHKKISAIWQRIFFFAIDSTRLIFSSPAYLPKLHAISNLPLDNSLHLFDACHLTTLAIIAIIACALIYICKKSSPCHHPLIVTPLAYICFLTYPLSLIAWNLAGLGDHLENVIPLHLCDLAAFACGFALLKRNQQASELAYFWGLAGTIQGLITPAIPVTFPHPVFIAFFIQHGMVVVTALLLPLGLGWKPKPKAILRVFIITQLYVATAMLFNLFADTNYGFLASKPESASLLDILPHWPYYILVLEAIALATFTLLYLPFALPKKNRANYVIKENKHESS